MAAVPARRLPGRLRCIELFRGGGMDKLEHREYWKTEKYRMFRRIFADARGRRGDVAEDGGCLQTEELDRRAMGNG